MSLSYSSNLISLPTAESAVRRFALHDSYSLILCNELPADVYFKLAKHFQLVQYKPGMNINDIDAGFVDCRGVEIRCPHDCTDDRPDIAFALIDEHSYLPEPCIDHSARLELITEAELDTSILKIRIDARKQRFSGTGQSNAMPTLVQDNALEVLCEFVKNSTDWIVLKDLNHRFLIASERFLKSHNKSIDEVVGKNDLEIGTPEQLVFDSQANDWKGYWSFDDEVTSSGIESYSEQMVVRENVLEQAYERVARIPVKNAGGKVIGLLVCITQTHTALINGVKVSSLASRHDIDQLAIIRRLDSERTKAEAISKQSQTAFKRKNNFIATASHDLRQPLHAIGLFIESLEYQIIDARQRATLAKMKQASEDLNALLNSILDISKLDADAIHASKAHFSVAPLLKSIEDEFETEAKRKALCLHVSKANAVLYTDSLLLSRIVRNLVGNAVKHTSKGHINVDTELSANTLLIRIKDTGTGIPQEQYQAIFSDIRPLDEQDTQPNFGMGLGLSIVKRLTDLLELDISLTVDAEQGTCFTLSVPLGNAASTATQAVTQEQSLPNEAHKLLVVEDNQVVLEAMQAMLTGLNCDVYPASDIQEAVEIIEELDELPDLLIVDYQLADGVTGDTAIETICQAANETLPAIIVTGNTNNALFRKASQSAYRVLNKPVNPATLLNTISSAIQEHNNINA